MAQKEKTDYGALVQELKLNEPATLYLLWGEEDYLRDNFLEQIKNRCLPDGEDGFNLKRFEGSSIDPGELLEAVETAPLFSRRCLIIVSGLNLNKLKDADAKAMREIFRNMPGHCTLVFIPTSGFEPDSRLSIIKDIRKHGREIEFTLQSQSKIFDWCVRRAGSAGKSIGVRECEHLVFTCGGGMNRLSSELDKLCVYSSGGEITIQDIDTVVTRLPEADIFNMTQCLTNGDYEGAASTLAELFLMRESPIMLLAIIGQQFRRLYATRLAIDFNLGQDYVRELTGIRFDFLLKKLYSSVKGTSASFLRRALMLCAETDYAMKSSSQNDENLLRDLLLKLSAVCEDD